MGTEEKQPSKTETQQRNKKYEMDMCSGSIVGKILLFSLPLMCSSILQLLFNAADIIVVGRFAGDNSLAAVGSNTSLINLLTNFFLGLSVGANVLVARYFGAKQEKDLSETVHTAMILSVCSGIILTIIGCLGAKQILIWMQTPEDVLPLAVIYLRIYFLGMAPTMLYNFGSAIMRAIGDTKRPLYYLFFAGVINVILNLIFVIVFRMDVAGVALATVISQTISAALIIRCMMRSDSSVHLELSGLRVHPDKFKRILQIGLPASFQGMVFSFSNVIIQSSVNSFGAIMVAGNSAAANIEGFVYVAMNAFHQAAISFTGQNVGAAKYERVNKILYASQFCVIAVGLLLGNAAVLWGEPLLGMYTSSPEVMEAGMGRLQIICGTYALCGMMDVMVGSLRGLGYSIMPMIVSLIGACGLRLLWIFTFFRMEPFHTIESLYLTYPVSWMITFLTHVICFIIVRRKLAKKWGR
ncbi:MAG: MATE family efflux transporter [Lachnospiraceae bacterium]|nr:MATE family efflux transporter [Lachnospiraceae bacterium]